jgi:hypothetical protein
MWSKTMGRGRDRGRKFINDVPAPDVHVYHIPKNAVHKPAEGVDMVRIASLRLETLLLRCLRCAAIASATVALLPLLPSVVVACFGGWC